MRTITKVEISREITEKLKEKYPKLTLRMTQDIITTLLHLLEEKVLKDNKTIRLRPYLTITQKERKTKKYRFKYVHFKAGKQLKQIIEP